MTERERAYLASTERERWAHWCSSCRTRRHFAEEIWHVTLTGKAILTGNCAECGGMMLPRIVKTAEAPPDVAAAAQAADRTYRHFRTAYKNHRNAAIERLTSGVRIDQELVNRLALAFELRPKQIWLILNGR